MSGHSRAVLFSLIRMHRPQVVAEIGTLHAGATEIMARALWENGTGIVYTTDVTAAGSKVQGVPIPDADNVIATYPIVTVKASKNMAVANAFIAYVLSTAGQTKLQSFGFLSAS